MKMPRPLAMERGETDMELLPSSPSEFNPVVSRFPDAWETLPTDIPASTFFDEIKGGGHHRAIEKIRERFATAIKRGVPYDDAKKSIDRQKQKLPSVSFAGILPMRSKNAARTFTGLMQADLDLLGDRLAEIRATLQDDPHCFMLFTSPSGEGLKAIYRIPICANDHEYKQAFEAVSNRVQDLVGVIPDELKDSGRLCFVSDDPDAFLNPRAIELPVDFSEMPVEEIASKQTAPRHHSTHSQPRGDSRREIAEGLLGSIEWESDGLGHCACPGETHHTTSAKPNECRVYLDGAPTIKCVHQSCAGAVAEANHQLRSEIGKVEWTPQAAPAPVTGANVDSTPPLRNLSARSPDEILGMYFSDDDIILGDRILAKGQPLVIAAQGGAGKSRIAMQLVASVVSGRKFLGFVTNGTELRWLILQTENSNRRLQQDLGRIKAWLGDDWARFSAQVVIHTIENDDDGFVTVESPDNLAAISRLIESHSPDVIVVDPLNEFAAGDLNKDADMRMTLQALSRVCRRGKPDRAIIVLHHSLTGKGGAVKATGYDRASFARNSKTLHAWTRGQINLVPVDPENNDRLVVACGKCSNGKEFPTFAVKLDPTTMIYDVDSTVDLSAWEADMTGKATGANIPPETVRTIVADMGKADGAPTKKQIAKSIQDETGCVRGSAYRAIDRAERAKAIHYTKTTKTYVIK